VPRANPLCLMVWNRGRGEVPWPSVIGCFHTQPIKDRAFSLFAKNGLAVHRIPGEQHHPDYCADDIEVPTLRNVAQSQFTPWSCI
jgi:hypothetical protein